jgi:hypothetical protein
MLIAVGTLGQEALTGRTKLATRVSPHWQLAPVQFLASAVVAAMRVLKIAVKMSRIE